jgi:hypothetical protein
MFPVLLPAEMSVVPMLFRRPFVNTTHRTQKDRKQRPLCIRLEAFIQGPPRQSCSHLNARYTCTQGSSRPSLSLPIPASWPIVCHAPT